MLHEYGASDQGLCSYMYLRRGGKFTLETFILTCFIFFLFYCSCSFHVCLNLKCQWFEEKHVKRGSRTSADAALFLSDFSEALSCLTQAGNDPALAHVYMGSLSVTCEFPSLVLLEGICWILSVILKGYTNYLVMRSVSQQPCATNTAWIHEYFWNQETF